MALNDVSGDPLALSNGGHQPLSASRNAASNTSTLVSNSHDPLTPAPSGDCPSPDGDDDVTVRDCVSTPQQKEQKEQRLHVVQRMNISKQSQNGGVVKQNGSLRNLPPSSAAPSTLAATDSQRLATRHLLSNLTPSSSAPPVQPQSLCCQHCHFHSTLCCPCGQQECPLFQNQGTDSGSGPIPHPGAASSCPCCLSACAYSHHQPHPAHSATPLCLHHHHQQRWQDHLQSQTPGIRYGEWVGMFSNGSVSEACVLGHLHTIQLALVKDIFV